MISKPSSKIEGLMMNDKALQIGDVQLNECEPIGARWIATGITVDFSGEEIAVSAFGDTRDEAKHNLHLQVWAQVFSQNMWALSEETLLIELVDLTLAALRTGEVGRGNRIQTVNMYERQRAFLIGKRGFPALGNAELRQCSTRAVHAWLALVAAKYPTSARHLKILLLHSFDCAIRQGMSLWKENPARTARLPQPRSAESVEISEEEFHGLLAHIDEWESKGKRTDLKGIVCCLMATGIRPGELPALLWEEVDLESSPATLIVSGCAVLQDNVLVRQPEPKTAAGFRQITLPEWFADMLRTRWKKRDPRCPFVFPSNAGTMLSMNNIGTRFREARGEQYRFIKLKSFRSTVATRIDREKGAEAAARHLGHMSPSITGRHYIKRPKETGDNSGILAAFDPDVIARLKNVSNGEAA